jgi:hypothetical protein
MHQNAQGGGRFDVLGEDMKAIAPVGFLSWDSGPCPRRWIGRHKNYRRPNEPYVPAIPR